MHYIGLDVHKKTIAYCAKTADGTIVDEGTIQALRPELKEWAAARPARWKGTLEATMFSGWIYDTLEPHADDLAVAHPASLEAITRAKRRATNSTAANFPTSPALTWCRVSGCRRANNASCAACCAFAIASFNKRSGTRTASPRC